MSRQSNEWACMNCTRHDECAKNTDDDDFDELGYCVSYQDVEYVDETE